MISKEYKFGTPDSSKPQFAIIMRAGKGLECRIMRGLDPNNINLYSTVEMLVMDYNYFNPDLNSKNLTSTNHPVDLPQILNKYLIDGKSVVDNQMTYTAWDYHSSEYDGELVAYEMRIVSIQNIINFLQEDGFELYSDYSPS